MGGGESGWFLFSSQSLAAGVVVWMEEAQCQRVFATPGTGVVQGWIHP